jgi:hypothetical protein
MGLRCYLDDNRSTPPGWDRAHTAEDVKLHLLHGDVEALSLDYDLDQPHCETCQFQCGHHGHNHPDGQPPKDCAHKCACHEAGDETGLDLVRWMAETGRWPSSKPVIHSANLHGGMKMAALIDQHYPRRK